MHVTRRSQISNISNKNQMENQHGSGYCLLKMENINDIFIILQYLGNAKSVHAGCHGLGCDGFKKICSSLSLPQPVTKNI